MEQKKDSIRKINQHKKEINKLRGILNQINEQKEASFRKKDQISRDISQIIRDVRNSKTKRNEFTGQVKESKKKREECNKEIRKKIEEIKKFNKEKTEIEKKYGIKEDPTRIKGEIERIESIIETEVISFQKEQKMMKHIKELKKKAKEAGKVGDVWNNIHKLSKEIDDLKKQSESVHKDVQDKAKESQTKHNEVIDMSKQVDKLKIVEEESLKQFVKFKKKFMETNDQLQEKLMDMKKLNEEINKFRKSKKQKKEKEIKTVLKEKEKIVMEKLAKGKKLTTEDILIIQGAEKENN
jgi:uncharacterized coiled-coil DUF342 family protein